MAPLSTPTPAQDKTLTVYVNYYLATFIKAKDPRGKTEIQPSKDPDEAFAQGLALAGSVLIPYKTFAVMLPSRSGQLVDPAKADQFTDELRLGWSTFMWSTRGLILSIVHSLPDRDAAKDHLKVAVGVLGNLIQPYYGTEAAALLHALLWRHAELVSEYTTAAKAAMPTDPVKDALMQNARDLGKYMQGMVPTLTLAAWVKDKLPTYIEQTLAQVSHRLAGEYSLDMAAFTTLQITSLTAISDELATGIIADKPEKFRLA